MGGWQGMVASLMKEAQELTAIFVASQNTVRKKK